MARKRKTSQSPDWGEGGSPSFDKTVLSLTALPRLSPRSVPEHVSHLHPIACPRRHKGGNTQSISVPASSPQPGLYGCLVMRLGRWTLD